MYTISGNTIMINDPELLRDIFIKDFHVFPDHINNIYFGSSHMSKGLFFLKGGDDWKRIRNIITPAFTSGKLRSMMGPISDITNRLVDMLVKYERTDSEKSDKDFGYDSISDDDPNDPTTGQTPTTKIPVGKLTTDEIVAQSTQFFLAGYDTSSAALSNAIYYLSEHKDCQQKLFDELDGCGDLSVESVLQLKYLNGVVNETLRLAPSFVQLFRTCVKDYKLGHTGITLPADTDVLISPYAIQRDPEYWPNPDAFIPERFIDPKHHPYAYVTFGAGPRLGTRV
ncbi:unnamed protein product [Oppiella nova]|uniref:Cytochrome P450 n=1 Tax=Oppiella nova TaxID=334625 RepID=A0A7R9M396_9ACAR|nr:unnamed protein product [Oppiella nova]CAG2169949.1 unnamed protein product [Oppiella nova]